MSFEADTGALGAARIDLLSARHDLNTLFDVRLAQAILNLHDAMSDVPDILRALENTAEQGKANARSLADLEETLGVICSVYERTEEDVVEQARSRQVESAQTGAAAFRDALHEDRDGRGAFVWRELRDAELREQVHGLYESNVKPL